MENLRYSNSRWKENAFLLMKLFDEKNRACLIISFGTAYRLSQLTADAFSIRKRANDNNP